VLNYIEGSTNVSRGIVLVRTREQSAGFYVHAFEKGFRIQVGRLGLDRLE
jgi:hypothetical protein